MSNSNNNPPVPMPPHDFQRNLVPVPSTHLQPRHPGGGLRQSAESQGAVTAQFVLNAVRQWWKVAIPLGLVLAAISGAVVYLLFAPAYEAFAWLEIKERAPYIAFPDRYSSRQFIDTQVQLIGSPLVLGPVLGRPEIARLPELEKKEAPTEWLKEQVKVSQVGVSELFTISYAGPDPENSAQLVNAVLEEYFKLKDRNATARSDKVIQLLEAERERRAQEVNRLRETVRELTKQATGQDPFAGKPAPEIVVQHPLAKLQEQLTNAIVEQEILRAQIRAFEDLAANDQVDVPEEMIKTAVAENAQVRALEAKLLAKRAELQEVELKLVDGAKKNEICARLRREIKKDEQLLDGLRNELSEDIRAELAASYATRGDDALKNMKSELKSYQLMQTLLEQRCEEQRKSIQQASGDTLELEFTKADLARAEQVFELIATRVVEFRTEQRAPARVELLQRAAVPGMPVERFPYKKVFLAVLASLCLPFGLAVLWERMVRRVTDAQQLEEHSSLAVVGEVARLPVRTTVLRDSSSSPIGRDLGIFEESIDSLRTCLILSEPLRDMKMLAVTSSTNREGKTSVAVQLAVSIARASGEPTLLVDGDMRAPDIHRVFEVPLEPGLGDVLAGQCALKDAIVTNWSDSVHFLPAGKLHASPHKLLGNGVLEALFEELRGSYRYIVVDTPPVLAAGEALVLARAADASLICAMRDVSRVDQIRKTHQRLLGAGARPVGIVLNGIPTKRYAYRYGSYGYSRG